MDERFGIFWNVHKGVRAVIIIQVLKQRCCLICWLKNGRSVICKDLFDVL